MAVRPYLIVRSAEHPWRVIEFTSSPVKESSMHMTHTVTRSSRERSSIASRIVEEEATTDPYGPPSCCDGRTVGVGVRGPVFPRRSGNRPRRVHSRPFLGVLRSDARVERTVGPSTHLELLPQQEQRIQVTPLPWTIRELACGSISDRRDSTSHDTKASAEWFVCGDETCASAHFTKRPRS